MTETFYEVMRRQGITRRSFLKFCSLTAASLGLGPAFAPQIAHAMKTKPRIPVLWLHGLECTCCSESFIRSAHPLAKNVVLSMLSLDYDDTLMAAAGHQAEAIIEEVVEQYKGNYICQATPEVGTRASGRAAQQIAAFEVVRDVGMHLPDDIAFTGSMMWPWLFYRAMTLPPTGSHWRRWVQALIRTAPKREPRRGWPGNLP